MRLGTVLTPINDENLKLAAPCGAADLVARYTDNEARGMRIARPPLESEDGVLSGRIH